MVQIICCFKLVVLVVLVVGYVLVVYVREWVIYILFGIQWKQYAV